MTYYLYKFIVFPFQKRHSIIHHNEMFILKKISWFRSTPQLTRIIRRHQKTLIDFYAQLIFNFPRKNSRGWKLKTRTYANKTQNVWTKTQVNLSCMGKHRHHLPAKAPVELRERIAPGRASTRLLSHQPLFFEINNKIVTLRSLDCFIKFRKRDRFQDLKVQLRVRVRG